MTEYHSNSAVTRIRTWVVSATTRSTNHYTITAIASPDRYAGILSPGSYIVFPTDRYDTKHLSKTQLSLNILQKC